MPFPDSRRVIYQKNPLEQVICQLRFPPILRIDAEAPARFQEAIRQEFPLFEEKFEGSVDIPSEVAEQLPAEFLRLPGISGMERRSFQFRTLDEQWTLSLTRDFIALSTSNYTRWEEFQLYFRKPFEVFLAEYSPAIFTRIGLRYQDVIRKSELGLEETPWSELLQPYIAGILAVPSVDQSHIKSTMQVVEMDLSDDYGKVTIRHGFATDKRTNEICYLIDNDFFAEKIKDSNDVIERLNHFNLRARRLFRWSITDRLHEAMEPEAIS